MFIPAHKLRIPTPEEALPGRMVPLEVSPTHAVNGHPTTPPFPGMSLSIFGVGCFWGAERMFWQVPGVFSTQVGYAGGLTPHPTYQEVCTGLTGHAEVVRVAYDPARTSFDQLLKLFWENHDPTEGMRQGGDIGTQYRSVIYTYDAAQLTAAVHSSRSVPSGGLSVSVRISTMPSRRRAMWPRYSFSITTVTSSRRIILP